MTHEHQQRLRKLTPDQREAVHERAAIIHEACPGTTWEAADDQAWSLEVEGRQPSLPGVSR